MVTATVLPDRVMDGMSVGRWLSFGVCLCVLEAESSRLLNIRLYAILVGDSVHRALAQHSLSVVATVGGP